MRPYFWEKSDCFRVLAFVFSEISYVFVVAPFSSTELDLLRRDRTGLRLHVHSGQEDSGGGANLPTPVPPQRQERW